MTSRSWCRTVLAALVVAVVLVPARPAGANHVVTWGAGSDCATAERTASTTVGSPVRFVVCTTIGGEPLPGHPMEVQVAGPTRSVTQPITTDDAGEARFAVQPTAPGTTTVTLCDADGCVYGSTTVNVEPAPTTTTATPAPPPAGVTTTTTAEPLAAPPPVIVEETTTTTATTSTTSTTDGASRSSVTTAAVADDPRDEDDGGGVPWLLIAMLAVVVIVVVALLLRRVLLAGGQPYGPYISPEELERLRLEQEAEKRRRRGGAVAAPTEPTAPAPTPPPAPTEPPPTAPGPPVAVPADDGATTSAPPPTQPVPAPPAAGPPVSTTTGDPVHSRPPPEAYCDWTVIYVGPEGEERLRHAVGAECCRFVINVQSTVFKTSPAVDRSDSMLGHGMTGADVGGGFSALGPLTELAQGGTHKWGAMDLETTVLHARSSQRVEGVNLTSNARVWEEPGAPLEVRPRTDSEGRTHAITMADVQSAIDARKLKRNDVEYRSIGPSMETLSQHVELTEIIVTRHTPCAPDDYVILAEGASELHREAGTSCEASSHEPGTCRNELWAAAGGRTDVSDDLEYIVDRPEEGNAEVRSTPGSANFAVSFDPELKLKADVLSAFDTPFVEFEGSLSVSYEVTPASGHTDPPVIQKYSHRPRPKHASEASEPYLRICVLNVGDVGAQVTWWRRASATAEAKTVIRHQFEVEGKRSMNKARAHTPATCECGDASDEGRRQCRCDPRFVLEVGRGDQHGRITVDGHVFVLDRPQPTAPSVTRWTLTPAVADGEVQPAPSTGTGTRTR